MSLTVPTDTLYRLRAVPQQDNVSQYLQKVCPIVYNAISCREIHHGGVSREMLLEFAYYMFSYATYRAQEIDSGEFAKYIADVTQLGFVGELFSQLGNKSGTWYGSEMATALYNSKIGQQLHTICRNRLLLSSVPGDFSP